MSQHQTGCRCMCLPSHLKKLMSLQPTDAGTLLGQKAAANLKAVTLVVTDLPQWIEQHLLQRGCQSLPAGSGPAGTITACSYSNTAWKLQAKP